jgi:pumilio RNA-binding family
MASSFGFSEDDLSGRTTVHTANLQSGFSRTRDGALIADERSNMRPMSGSDDQYGDFLSKSHVSGLVRSQSAAPKFHTGGGAFGSPPGFSGLESHHHTDSFGLGMRRAASAGDDRETVRPAAKTLMDLIQEDEQDPNLSVESAPAALRASAGIYDLPGQGSASPAINNDFASARTQSSLQQQLQHDRLQQVGSIGGGSTRYQQSIPQQQNISLVDLQQHNVSPIELNQPVSMLRQVSQQQQLVLSTQEIVQGGQDPYLHHQQPSRMHLQGSQHVTSQQQQLFYGGQQRLSLDARGVPTHSIQQQGLQAQVLPNGQTVYVTTSPSQQHTFGGFTTLQYPSHHQQQPQIIHQSVHGLPSHSDQFVSVIPIHGGGQQVTYWQPGGVSQQQHQHTMNTSSGIVTGPGGTSIALSSVNTQGFDQHLSLRRDKGGRGRRGGSGGSGRGRGDSKSSTTVVTCPLLEEFRSSKSRDWTIRRIDGYIVDFCQDQNGSRFIQQRLEMGDVVEQQIVMREVLPAIRRLRNDVFGNYVVQKLLDFGTPEVKNQIRETLEGEMLQLSLQMYGCRVVQKALEALDEDDLPRLLREFHHNVLSCIHDQNGNHVIQKCIEVLNSRADRALQMGDTHRAYFLSEQIDFVIDDVLVNTLSLSCHPYGCRVLQRILEHCNEQKKTAVLDELLNCHKRLLDDQYGNYVIQHVLQFGRDEDRDSILQIIVENGLLDLSRQKFASNVVEKLLKYGNANQRRAVVREMLKVGSLCVDFVFLCEYGDAKLFSVI